MIKCENVYTVKSKRYTYKEENVYEGQSVPG